MTAFERASGFRPADGDRVLAAGEGERLLARFSVPELAGAIAEARAHGQRSVLIGALEAPDVPRLLALNSDVLAVPDAQFGLLAETAAAPRRSRMSRKGADRIFIRGLVLPVAIGAYARERGREQRVRFDVTADLNTLGTAVRGMADIFSYDIVLDTIETVVAQGHIDLLETLAEDIAERLLAHEAISRISITLEKLDLGPAVAGVEIVRER